MKVLDHGKRMVIFFLLICFSIVILMIVRTGQVCHENSGCSSVYNCYIGTVGFGPELLLVLGVMAWALDSLAAVDVPTGR